MTKSSSHSSIKLPLNRNVVYYNPLTYRCTFIYLNLRLSNQGPDDPLPLPSSLRTDDPGGDLFVRPGVGRQGPQGRFVWERGCSSKVKTGAVNPFTSKRIELVRKSLCLGTYEESTSRNLETSVTRKILRDPGVCGTVLRVPLPGRTPPHLVGSRKLWDLL